LIRPLRRRHRRTILALAIALPALYAAALAVRPWRPEVTSLAGLVPGPPPAGARSLGEWSDLWPGLPITTRRLRAPAGAELVELRPRRDLREPGVLLYWRRAASGGAGDDTGAGLPPDAVLLGAVAGTEARSFALPPGAGGEGELWLWSLGHGRAVGRARLPAGAAGGDGGP
jgi:hypothetical protein